MNMVLMGVSGTFNNSAYLKIFFTHLYLLTLLNGFTISPSVLLGIEYSNIAVNQGQHFQ
jgi:hypothetical protein